MGLGLETLFYLVLLFLDFVVFILVFVLGVRF